MVRHLVYYREHHNTETEQLPHHFPLSQKTFKMYGELIIMWCWHRGWPHLVTIQSDPAHILLPGSLLPLSSQLPGINNRSIYWVTIWPESEPDTADSHPHSHRFTCPHFFLVLSWYYFSLSSSQWWMYLQIFLPSFVLSQLYNWPARASVSRVSAPRVRWNWSHYRDGITAHQTSPALWAAILKSQYWHCIEPSLSLSPIKY